MAKKVNELESLEQYLRSESNEKSRQHLLYPVFQKLFPDKFKIEGDAKGADIYVEGSIIVESKTSYSQWLEGFYQALHYKRKSGLSYSTIMVIAHEFVGIWKLDKLPEFATILANTSSILDAPSKTGKENAKKTQLSVKKEIKDSAFYWLEPSMLAGEFFINKKSLGYEVFEIVKILKNLDSNRIMVNRHNFIKTIERMKSFFNIPIDAVHAFYALIPYWDITSKITERPNGQVSLVGFNGNKSSEDIVIEPRNIYDFKKFVEAQYIFTNEGSGITVDYYFSRFDEVLAVIDPEYVKQHGIFFTNDSLSKFALWFVQHHFSGDINENYIVFDPAGGSGNLVSSWRGKLKHKIISELQPDLLRTIERRMQADPFHIDTGFTIIPRTSSGEGLNFLDKSAEEYMERLQAELQLKNVAMDKPLAFLLNPPYKNIRERDNLREDVEANYDIHQSILDFTGPDGSQERYLAFLAQIVMISETLKSKNDTLDSVLFIFTPTSWLIPRPGFVYFREKFDTYFKFVAGFLITSNEFFKLDGRWPLSFTMWKFSKDDNRKNEISFYDFTDLTNKDFYIDWNDEKLCHDTFSDFQKKSRIVNYSKDRGSIRDILPELTLENGKRQRQGMQNLYRSVNKEEEGKKIISGFALKDLRHSKIKAPHGYTDGNRIGFMDDLSPVRIRGKNDLRYFGTAINSVWFRIDTSLKDINKSKCFNGSTDNRSYCAYDLASAKATMTWFSITKALNGVYPVWANQYDIWAPTIPNEKEGEWYSLCFAFVLAENRCVVAKFEKDNPVPGAPEVFVDNPLCPNNKESFWSTTLNDYVKNNGSELAVSLVTKIAELYKYWNTHYCKGQYLTNVGLHNEPYFKYFSYPDFLTPYSGLIQIKKYAELEGKADLQQLFSEVSDLTKQVKKRIYEMLVGEFGYFE